MKQCEQLEKFYTEYVCDLLDEEQAARIQEHLEGCAACAREVQSLQNTLRLTEEAEEIPIPPVILDNIEMNVYKRLATEAPPPQRSPFFAKCVAAFQLFSVKRRPAWILHSALATLVLVIGISIATVLINQDRPPDIPPIPPSQERIDLYRQTEIQNNRTEALETKHLKGNDRLATLQLLVLAEAP